MPEGPEIHRAAAQLREILAGKTTSAVHFAFSHLHHFEELLRDQCIVDVRAQGKAILITFDLELTIYSHNQLYGKWIISHNGELPETNRSLRLALHTSAGAALLYSASEIEVLTPDEVLTHPYLQRLGPDLLAEDTTLSEVLTQVNASAFQRKSLLALLLDQGFLAGPGNYLRSEVLFDAGLSPDLRLGQCSPEQRQQLADSALSLARRSYATGGITTARELADTLKKQGASRREYRHYVFNRDDRPCHICGAAIRKASSSGRRYYFCPVCQAG